MRDSLTRLIVLLSVTVVAVAGCTAADAERAAADPDPDDWPAVLEAARGQTLDWYMYTGDEAVNAVVAGHVGRRLADEFGVTLNVVGVTDTADAVNKVLAEQQAGRSAGGSVDAIWINGENFATGKQAGLWFCGFPERLPNARFVDFTDPAVAHDFGVPVDAG